jgi:hypothetical protein
VHGVLSGIFNTIMTFAPEVMLPLMAPLANGAGHSADTVAWGHVMGACELTMTVVYLCGAVTAMQPFITLSGAMMDGE